MDTTMYTPSWALDMVGSPLEQAQHRYAACRTNALKACAKARANRNSLRANQARVAALVDCVTVRAWIARLKSA